MDRFKKNRPSAIDGILEKRLGRIMRNMAYPGKNISYFSTWEPAVDIYQLEEYLILYMDVSGVAVDDISIIAESEKLIISGERKCSVSGITSVHQLENEYGPFKRIIELPVAVDIAKTTSESVNGFLEVRMPILQDNGLVEIKIKND